MDFLQSQSPQLILPTFIGIGPGRTASTMLYELFREHPGICTAAGTVELGLRLPTIWKVRNGWTKYALRAAMSNRLPDEITWHRLKRGFAVPQKQWVDLVRGPLDSWLRELPAGCPIRPEPLIAALNRGLGGEQWLWRVISTALWIRFLGVHV